MNGQQEGGKVKGKTESQKLELGRAESHKMLKLVNQGQGYQGVCCQKFQKQLDF